MALNLQDKKAIVAEVNEAASGALSAVVADSRGVEVGAMTSLRKQAREAGVYMKVVRNTLARRAVQGTDYECLVDTFTGPTLIAFSNEHPGAAARLFKQDTSKSISMVRKKKIAAIDDEYRSVLLKTGIKML